MSLIFEVLDGLSLTLVKHSSAGGVKVGNRGARARLRSEKTLKVLQSLGLLGLLQAGFVFVSLALAGAVLGLFL